MTIKEGNKLIAEFMGLKQSDNVLHKSGSPTFTSKDNHGFTMFITLEQLKYNTSWDWLMPVVEKIEKQKGVRLYIKPYACEIIVFGKQLVNEIADTKIECVWQAVVEFIQWHNEQTLAKQTTANA